MAKHLITPHDDEHVCPICLKPFKPADLCTTDITEGICHAACLEGSSIVDIETGEPVDGPISTYTYASISGTASGSERPADPSSGVISASAGREVEANPYTPSNNGESR